MRMYDLTDWLIRRRRHLTTLRRLWLERSHEVCCSFDVALAAFVAPRLKLYSERVGGAPGGYPDPDKADWLTDPDNCTDFEAWERDVKRAALAAEQYAGRYELLETDIEEETRIAEEWRWAMQWLGRWSGGIWV